jgi:hypothetical protein
MFRVVLPPIIRSAYNCVYSIWYLSHRYCYLPLSWKSWNRFECSVSTPPTDVDTVVCAPDDRWKYHPKHIEQFPDIYNLCNVASRWIYIGILLEAHPILHISKIRVKLAGRSNTKWNIFFLTEKKMSIKQIPALWKYYEITSTARSQQFLGNNSRQLTTARCAGMLCAFGQEGNIFSVYNSTSEFCYTC